MPDYELRIGICGCTSKWTGKLEGQTIMVPSLGKHPLYQPMTLNLLEVSITEEVDRIQALREANCHLFLDVADLGNGMRETELTRFWRTDYGENRLGGRGGLWEEAWVGKRSPELAAILRGTGRLIGKMSPMRFLLWTNNLPEPSLKSF